MNQFDPTMKVTIADLSEGVPPDVLHFNQGTGPNAKLLTFEPNLDTANGTPLYVVPRDYASRLLENKGGRTYRLVSPNHLLIKVSNGKGGSGYEKIIAWVQDPMSKKWRQKTEDEISKEEPPSVGPAMVDVLNKAPVKKDEDSKPEEAQQATKESRPEYKKKVK